MPAQVACFGPNFFGPFLGEKHGVASETSPLKTLHVALGWHKQILSGLLPAVVVTINWARALPLEASVPQVVPLLMLVFFLRSGAI